MTLFEFMEKLTNMLTKFSGDCYCFHRGGDSYLPHIYRRDSGLGYCVFLSIKSWDRDFQLRPDSRKELLVCRPSPHWNLNSPVSDGMLVFLCEETFSYIFSGDEIQDQAIETLSLYILQTTNNLSPLKVLLAGTSYELLRT